MVPPFWATPSRPLPYRPHPPGHTPPGHTPHGSTLQATHPGPLPSWPLLASPLRPHPSTPPQGSSPAGHTPHGHTPSRPHPQGLLPSRPHPLCPTQTPLRPLPSRLDPTPGPCGRGILRPRPPHPPSVGGASPLQLQLLVVRGGLRTRAGVGERLPHRHLGGEGSPNGGLRGGACAQGGVAKAEGA